MIEYFRLNRIYVRIKQRKGVTLINVTPGLNNRSTVKRIAA